MVLLMCSGLWRGYLPNLVRNSIICAAELASYDEVKQRLLASRTMSDGVGAHLVYEGFRVFLIVNITSDLGSLYFNTNTCLV